MISFVNFTLLKIVLITMIVSFIATFIISVLVQIAILISLIIIGLKAEEDMAALINFLEDLKHPFIM